MRGHDGLDAFSFIKSQVCGGCAFIFLVWDFEAFKERQGPSIFVGPCLLVFTACGNTGGFAEDTGIALTKLEGLRI